MWTEQADSPMKNQQRKPWGRAAFGSAKKGAGEYIRIPTVIKDGRDNINLVMPEKDRTHTDEPKS